MVELPYLASMNSYSKIGRRKTQREELKMRRGTGKDREEEEEEGGEGREREGMRRKNGERSQRGVKAM